MPWTFVPRLPESDPAGKVRGEIPGRLNRMSEVGGVSAERLKTFVERIERLEEEKAALAADIREVYSEAKGSGFDTRILRQVVRLRKMDGTDRREQEELLDLYKRALDL
jgi:uncharacterized protein (UPF0335 family)